MEQETTTKVIVLNLSLLEVLGQGKVNEALVLQQVDYWCTINKNKNENFIDGNYWMFSSVKKMLERDFPLCFSLDTLKRVLNNLEEADFLITKKHKNGKLYRVNYNKISFNKNLKSDKNITKNESGNQKSRLVQNAPTKKVELVQNAPTENVKIENEVSAKCPNGYSKMPQPVSADCPDQLVQNAPTKKVELVQNAPTENVKIENEVSAKCPNGYSKMPQPVSADCPDQLVQNAPTIKDINKENNIYIKYNNFINNTDLSKNKDMTDKVNLYNQTTNNLIYFGELKKDVELAISRANEKVTGSYNINGVQVDVSLVKQALKSVSEKQIDYCVKQILNSKKITNFENYVIASLYNSVIKDIAIKSLQNQSQENSILGNFNWYDK